MYSYCSLKVLIDDLMTHNWNIICFSIAQGDFVKVHSFKLNSDNLRRGDKIHGNLTYYLSKFQAYKGIYG